MLIRSPDNPIYRRLKRFNDSPRDCRKQRRTLAEGVHLIEAALAAEVEIITLVVRATGTNPASRELSHRAGATRGIDVIEMAPNLYDHVSPVVNGAGVLAEIALETAPTPTAFDDDAVFLEGVQDPGNVGALLRTAVAAGVDRALAGTGCAYVGSPRVVRAAMGAHFTLALHEDVDLDAARAAFKGTLLVADATNGESLFGADWGSGPTLWLFGGEGQGVSPRALALADRRIRIPLAEGVESLNVAAAAAVCLFEQRRRRLFLAQ